jgi:hypothetical protein
MRRKKPARKKTRRQPQKTKRRHSKRAAVEVLEFRHPGLKGLFRVELPAGWKQRRLPVLESEPDS